MAKSKQDRTQERFLTKTQEVLYQKEFKRANRIYSQFSQRGDRS